MQIIDVLSVLDTNLVFTIVTTGNTLNEVWDKHYNVLEDTLNNRFSEYMAETGTRIKVTTCLDKEDCGFALPQGMFTAVAKWCPYDLDMGPHSYWEWQFEDLF